MNSDKLVATNTILSTGINIWYDDDDDDGDVVVHKGRDMSFDRLFYNEVAGSWFVDRTAVMIYYDLKFLNVLSPRCRQ